MDDRSGSETWGLWRRSGCGIDYIDRDNREIPKCRISSANTEISAWGAIGMQYNNNKQAEQQ